MRIPQNSVLKIAVIGAGAAGLTAAYLLQRKHEVTLFERNGYLGGHTNTLLIPDGPDAGTSVDTGFIVYNDRNYPNLIRLFSHLGISGQPSDMSFGFYSEEKDFMYNSYVPGGLFAQKKNLFRPAFYAMVRDILRFNKKASADLLEDRLQGLSLGEYLEKGKYSASFRDCYILPMGAAIWSTPADSMLRFPACTFLRFFHNHGLLSLKGRPHWMTVPGGSHSYIKAMTKRSRWTARLNVKISCVRRSPDGISIHETDGRRSDFDYVVIAAHADEALKLLEKVSSAENELLGAWSYTENRTLLHTEGRWMPPLKKAWASWNYIEEKRRGSGPPFVSLTYHMNRLQRLKASQDYFVTLNTSHEISPAKIVKEIVYTHPLYTEQSLRTQERLPSLNGRDRTFYCGSYFGYGFHEDAVKSAFEAAKHFGMKRLDEL